MGLSIPGYWSHLGLGPYSTLSSGFLCSPGLSHLITLLPWMGLGDSSSSGISQGWVLALAAVFALAPSTALALVPLSWFSAGWI